MAQHIWALRTPAQGSKNRPPSGHLRLKKSHLASEKILLADSLATESCRLADRFSTKLSFKADNADADRTWLGAQGLWQTSLSVQDARELAVRARRSCLRVNPPPGAFPEILLPRPSELCGVKKISYACDCQFARHISLHTSPCQLVFEPSKCPQCIDRDRQSETNAENLSRERAFGQRRRGRNRRIRRRMFEGGRREGDSSKEEESSKASLMFFSYTRINCRYGLAI